MQNRISSLFSKWAVAIAILVGCSRSVGSESNFVTCEDDTDCSAGTCVAGKCKVSGGGGGGATGGGGSGPRTDAGPPTGDGGRQGDGGNCSTAGAYTLVAGAAGAGAGANAGGSGAATCPIDANGFATVDQPTFCAMYRCPSTEAELVKGFTCTEATTDHVGVTITTGCGVQTVTIAGGDGYSYSAHFTPGNNGAVALEAQQPGPFGTCNVSAYRTGQAPPACASDATYKCRPTDPAGSGYSGCRKPGDPGCGTCCSPAVEGSPQNAPTCIISGGLAGDQYGLSDTQFGPCPCNCAACASCTPDLERRILTDPNGPACDCTKFPDPITGAGGGGDPCAAICPYQRQCNGIR